jgi:hypothetical protein
MRSLEQLDSWISRKVRTWSSRTAGSSRRAELLEIRRDILSEIRDHIQAKGEGKSIFPYNRVVISMAAQDSAEQAVLEEAFSQGAELQETICALLSEAGCPVPAGFEVTVSVLPDAPLAFDRHPFDIKFHNAKLQLKGAAPNTRPPAKLIVIAGDADAPEYSIDSDQTNLGRLKEVLSDKDGLRRRNHVAFAETETTVSREHAFIRYDSDTGRFRVFDCVSHRGTRVFRDGRRFDVPKGPSRGLQLQPGDEIHLGNARLRFESDSPARG